MRAMEASFPMCLEAWREAHLRELPLLLHAGRRGVPRATPTVRHADSVVKYMVVKRRSFDNNKPYFKVKYTLQYTLRWHGAHTPRTSVMV